MSTHVKPRYAALVFVLVTGCVRQDTEILGRVSRKLADRAREATASLREKVPLAWPKLGGESLTDQVKARLRTDRGLQGTQIDVAHEVATVELRGNVANDEQKRRAIELAESTVGVEKVTDALTIAADRMP